MDSFILRSYSPNEKSKVETNQVLGSIYRVVLQSRDEQSFNDYVDMIHKSRQHIQIEAGTLGFIWPEDSGLGYPIHLVKGNVYYITLNGRTVDTINLNK